MNTTGAHQLTKAVCCGCFVFFLSCSGNSEIDTREDRPAVQDTSYPVIRVASQWQTDLDKVQDTIFYSESVTDNVYTLRYAVGNDTDTYILKADERFVPRLLSKGFHEKGNRFLYDGKRPFQVGRDVYAVYKYAVLIDSSGCSSSYWNPRLGIFYTKSNKWKTFNVVRTLSDSLRNAVTGKLILLIEQDSVFANVCPELKQDSL
ncbi:MAG: hypothetical protein AB1458_04990 [Bacteroidota bacterium]